MDLRGDGASLALTVLYLVWLVACGTGLEAQAQLGEQHRVAIAFDIGVRERLGDLEITVEARAVHGHTGARCGRGLASRLVPGARPRGGGTAEFHPSR